MKLIAVALCALVSQSTASNQESDCDSCGLSLLQHRVSALKPSAELLKSEGTEKQTPCEWCQAKCYEDGLVELHHCLTSRNCDNLPKGASKCNRLCSGAQTVTQEHCLVDCPCNPDELADQESAAAERAEVKQEAINSGEVEQEVEADKQADMVPDEDDEPEEETEEASAEEIEAIDPNDLMDPAVENEE